MVHLLIDTCSLRQLIDQKGYSKSIDILIDEISNKRIKLFSHRNIIEEWNKHKLKWQKDIERKIDFFGKDHTNSQMLPNLYHDRTFLSEQLSAIDKMLECSEKLETPDGIANEMFSRHKSRLAPFHKKLDSSSDWEIIGTVANHCDNYRINQLIFISFNHTDFGSEIDEEGKLHSTLVSRFKNVDIKYYKTISDFLEDYQSVELYLSHNFNHKILPSSKYTFESSLKNNVLDGLYYLYKEKYKEINFIPTKFLKNYYPFKASKKSNLYIDTFKISNVNSDLINFFKGIQILRDGTLKFENEHLLHKIDNYYNKTVEVLQKLESNAVLYLNNDKVGTVELPVIHKVEKCNCYRCNFYRFDYENTLKTIPNEGKDTKEKLKIAYIHYMLFNYETAIKIYKDVVDTIIINKEPISYIIAKYNLRHLSVLLKNLFVNKKDNSNLVYELEQIDLFEELYKVKGITDYNLVSYIVDDSFFNNAFQEISEKTKEIVEHFHLQSRGGWRSSNKVWVLINEFTKIEQFLDNNYIIYNKFLDYERLFDNVLSGLLASHSLDEDQGGRFKSFNLYWIKKIIIHSRKENIIKYIKQYKIKELKYNLKKKNELIELINNILYCNIKNVNFLIDSNNNGIINDINEKVENLITILSFLELDNKLVNTLGVKILKYTVNTQDLNWKIKETILLFIRRKHVVLSKSLLIEYLEFFLKDENFNNYEYIEEILKYIGNDSSQLIKDDFFELLINYHFNSPDFSASFNVIVNIYQIVDFERRKYIKKKVRDKLKKDFDFQTFYLSSIYNIIPKNEAKIILLLDSFIIDEDKKCHSIRNVFSGKEEVQLGYLDELINLCFKFNIDTNQLVFDKFKKINDYYDWLLGMDKYNYDKFKNIWITLYPTLYYINKMKKSTSLKIHLKNEMSKSFDEKIAKIYFKLI